MARDRATALVQAGDHQLARAGLALRLHSDAVVIGKRLNRDGAPLLLGGPQTGYSVPQTWLEVGLHGAGYDVTRVTIPGTVAVEIGVGSNDAWSVTSGGTDNSDWYTETVDPAHHPGRYLFRGRWVRYHCRTEKILVRGHRPQAHQVCESVHGPVYATASTTALSLKDATRDGVDGTFGTFLGLDRAASAVSPRDFAAVLRGCPANFNFLYADGHLNQLTRQHHSANPGTWLQPVASIRWSPLGIGKVPDTPWMNRGTYNQIVHVGTGSRLTAEDVVAPGQSGDPASRHFADQLRMYTTWSYKTMRLTRRDLVGHTESVLTLGVPSAPQAARNLRSGR